MMTQVLLPVLQWWLATTAVMLAGLPLARRILKVLPDAGLSVARPVGILAGGLCFWLLGMLGVLPGGWLGAALSLGLVATAGWSLERGDGPAWRDFLATHRRRLIGFELIYLLGLLLFAWFRSFNPAIETSGGEKWMEMAFLSSVLESPSFPPMDPWLAGYGISYYHLHYLIAGWLTKLSAVNRYLAFNLMIPMTLGMTLAAATGLGYNLVALSAPRVREAARWATGALAATLLVLMGNLHAVLEAFYLEGWLPAAFYDGLGIKNLGVNLTFCGEANAGYGQGRFWPDRFIWWWRSSRVIADVDAGGGCREVIHEFPFFSFMLGDVHPHVLTLPYVLLALTLVLAVLAGGYRLRRGAELWTWRWLALPVILGALGFFNTWDLPTFMGLVGLAFLWVAFDPRRGAAPPEGTERLDLFLATFGLAGLSALGWRLAAALGGADGAPVGLGTRTLLAAGLALGSGAAVQVLWSRRERGGWEARLLAVLRIGVWLGALGLLCYLPFYASFSSQAKGVGLVDIRSRLDQWLVHFGPLFWLALSGILLLATAAWRGAGAAARRAWGLGLAVGGGALLACLLLQAWTAALLVVLVALALTAAVALWLGNAAGVAVGANEDLGAEDDAAASDDPIHGAAPGEADGERIAGTFALLCLGAGLALPLLIEFVFLKDLFNNRMNSVFKFYYQAWVLLAIGGAYAAFLAWRRLRRPLAMAWSVPTALLVAGGLVFTLAAVRDRTRGFTPQPGGLTLNGLSTWPEQQAGDWGAVQWLLANSRRGEAILEAPGGGYDYAGRISMASGRPTVLGWAGHEHQWRGDAALALTQEREADIRQLYGEADDAAALALLTKYNIRYVIVGRTERGWSGFDPASDQRFARMLKLVYDSDPGNADSTRIFQRP